MKTLLVLIGLTAFVLTACGDDEDTPAASNGGTGGSGAAGSSGTNGASGSSGRGGTSGSGGGGTGGTASDAAVGISISGIAHDWAKADPFATPPLARVEVCLREHPEVACVTTGADGSWTLRGVPTNAEVMVTLELAGRISFLRAIKTATADIMMQPFENAITLVADVPSFLPNVTVDFAKGGIVFFITMPGTRFQNGFDWLRGFTVTMTPSSGQGPLYLDATHTHDPAATSSAGGWGHYVNLETGTYTLEFAVPPGTTCSDWAVPMYGYPTDQPLKIRVPVVAGFATGPVGLFCTPPASDGGADAAPSDGGTG
jgi:hypothetical protein